MMCFICKNVTQLKIVNHTLESFRYVRNVSKRITAMKTIREFKIKNNEEYYDLDNDVDYKEIAKQIKENDLDIEETFTKGEDLETIVSESSQLYDIHQKEEKCQKSFLQKKMIGRKYFNEGKETNLLTYAAKEQIRNLYQINPDEWTPEALANSFPISVNGVKKLLKSNYVLTSPERIKAHDEDVRMKWDILKSGKSSDLISHNTQTLWKEGKLKGENYSGNPKLPMNSSIKNEKTIIVEKKKNVGEYASIIQKYVDMKKQKDSLQNANTEYSEKSDQKRDNYFQKPNSFIDHEGETFKYRLNNYDKIDFPYSQFKENLKSELRVKNHKSSASKKYYEWIEEDSMKNSTENSNAKPLDGKDILLKIPKYDKEKGKFEIKKVSNKEPFYIYDNKLGYQHPHGRMIKGKIRIGKLFKKNSTYKMNNCIYDENGEFLYKLPT